MEKIVDFVGEVISSHLFLLTLTVVAYHGAQLLHRKVNILLLNPIVVASIIIIITLRTTGIAYAEYFEANSIINFLLGLSVVPLSYLMHKNVNRIKEYKVSILCSTFVGSIIGVLSVIGFAHLFGFESIISISLQPKSVTTPIALSLSTAQGGIPALTALSVVVAGISGNVMGVWILKLCRITDPVARGLALGSASHAVGTARALELGAVEGAIGGAAIGLMGLFTSIVLPIINRLI
ncbi:MAG: LrgB family protein [Rikenellaceae bacterium]